MTLCINPNCQHPENPDTEKFCLNCGTKLILRERYRPIKLLGAGGFGRTFLAIDEDIPSKPRCAIKQFYFFSPNPEALKKATELFEQEAVRLDSLGSHPQIPHLMAFFKQDDRLYLVQEFIEGVNLEQELEEKLYDEAQIWQLLKDLLPVLEFIHQHKVIHRDIKPENIIRNQKNGKPMLIDFGIAKIINTTVLIQTGELSMPPGTVIGTQDFAPPEQMRGIVFPASDLYSLGATCTRLLTGESPSKMYNAYNQTLMWRQFLPKGTVVSDRLGQVLDKLLDSNLNGRYQSASEVLQAIESPPVTSPLPTNPVITQFPQSSSPDVVKRSRATKFTYWLMGEKAGRVIVTAWKWLWGMPID